MEAARSGPGAPRVPTGILEPYVDKIYGFALRRTADRDAAEDLAQEILLALCRSLARQPEIRHLHAWVWQVARHTHARFLRQRYREEAPGTWEVLSAGWADIPTEDPLDGVSRREEVAAVVAALGRTAAQRRRVLVMRYLQDRPVSAIAAATGLPVGTVKRRLHEARKRLRERMREMAPTQWAEPIPLTVYTNGSGAPDSYIRRRLTQSIVLAAFPTPRTVEELADALGVAAPFIEDELHHLAAVELVARIGSDHYHTDFVIASLDVQRRVDQDIEALVARHGGAVRDAFARVEAAVRDVGFHGADRPWPELLWTLVPLTFFVAQGRYCAQHGLDWDAPPRSDGGRWYASGFEGEGGASAPFFWRGGHNFETANWGSVTATFQNMWFEGLGLKAGMLAPHDIRLIVGEAIPGAAPRDGDDDARAAELVMRGFLERAGASGQERLRPTVAVYTRAQRERLLAVLSPVLELHAAILPEAYAACRARLAPEVPRRLHAQLPAFIAGLVGATGGHLLGFLVDRGVLQLPADPATSTLAMCITLDPRD